MLSSIIITFLLYSYCFTLSIPTSSELSLFEGALNQSLGVNDEIQMYGDLKTLTASNQGCIPKAWHGDLRPHFADCGQAVRLLATGSKMEDFTSKTPGRTQCQLPTSMAFGSCRIRVELAEGIIKERTSWMEIGLAATELLIACFDGAKTKTGGVTQAGEYNKINIHVVKLKDYDDVAAPVGMATA